MRGSSSIIRADPKRHSECLLHKKNAQGHVQQGHGGQGPVTTEAETDHVICCSGDVKGSAASSPGPPHAVTSQVHASPHTAALITPRPASPGEPEGTTRDTRNEDTPAAPRALSVPVYELEFLAAVAHGPWGQRARSER